MSKLSETPYRHNTGGMGGIRLPHLQGYATLLDRIGAREESATLADAIARHDAIGEAARAATDQLDAERDHLARAVATGDIDPVNAAERLAKAEARSALAGPARGLVVDARRSVVTDEVRRLRARGDALVTDLLAPIVHAAAVEFLDAYDSLPEGVDNPSAAIAAGTSSADAWRVATDSLARIANAWRLADAWRKDGILFTLRPPSEHPRYWQWYEPPAREPGTFPEWAAAITEKRRPTVLTAREVIGHHVAPPSPERLAAYARRDALAAKLNGGTGPEAA